MSKYILLIASIILLSGCVSDSDPNAVATRKVDRAGDRVDYQTNRAIDRGVDRIFNRFY